MQALWFLTWRLLVNSVRRTFTNPLRATLAVLVILWFAFTIGSNLFFSLRHASVTATPLPADLRQFHTEYLIALLMGVHLVMLWQPLFPVTFRTVPLFTQADIHFLFPSPQRHLPVFLFLLFTRGLVNSLVVLLILLIMAVAMGHDLLVSLFTGNVPAHARLTWVYPTMYLLAFVALLITGILIVLREERQPGFYRRLKGMFWGLMGALASVLGWHGYRAWQRGSDPLQEMVWHLLHNPILVVPLFPLRALAEAAVAFSAGWTPAVSLGFVLWGGALGGAMVLLWRYEHLLYDVAAQIATLSTSYAWRRQSPAQAAYEASVAAAQKRKRTVRWRLFERWVPQGAWALLWCHSLLMLRLSNALQIPLTVLLGSLVMVLVFIVRGEGLTPSDKVGFMVVIQYMSTVLLVLTTQSWLVSVIRRAEMNRSLPFAARVVLWTEVLPPTLTVWLLQIPLCAVFGVILPTYLLTFILHALVSMSFVPLLFTVMLTVYLMFPDQSDYTQRMLLGVLLFPALLLASAPALVALGICALFGLPFWAQATTMIAANLGVWWVSILLAAQQYVHINLAE
jgi:hypothetical protein